MWLVGHISPSPHRADQPEIPCRWCLLSTLYSANCRLQVWWLKEPHNVFYMWSRSYSETPLRGPLIILTLAPNFLTRVTRCSRVTSRRFRRSRPSFPSFLARSSLTSTNFWPGTQHLKAKVGYQASEKGECDVVVEIMQIVWRCPHLTTSPWLVIMRSNQGPTWLAPSTEVKLPVQTHF